MEIKVVRVPQFMSKKVNVIMVDGKPLCTCRGNFTTQSIIARLQGYDVEIKDGRILKLIESEEK
jgi:hypothetical protein